MKKQTTCDDCNETIEDGYRFCESCEANYVWCNACQDWYRDELGSTCRHLQWIDEEGWCGAGGCRDSGFSFEASAAATHRESFLKVVELTGIAPELRMALRATYCRRGRWGGVPFYFRLGGSILGADHIDVELMGAQFGDRFNKLYGVDDPREYHAGIQWLLSLWPSNPKQLREGGGYLPTTPKAIKLTLKWLEEPATIRKAA